MDRHEKNSSLYDRLLKTATLYFKVSIESGVAKADLGSAMAMATQTQDDITSLGETLAPAPSDASGIFYAALKQSEAESMEEVYEAEVISADLVFGSVAAEASITSSGNLLVKFDSDQDITGDDGEMTVKLTYRR
jgi:hypothetical protein